jgi:hypothetical protein
MVVNYRKSFITLALILTANVRLGWQWMAVTNDIATLITGAKSCIAHATGVGVTLCHRINKLECLSLVSLSDKSLTYQ